VSIARNCTVRAVEMIVAKLKNKGYLDIVNRPSKKLRFFESTNEETSQKKNFFHQIRLHGQEFNIKIIYKSLNYNDLIGKIIKIDSNTVRLYKNSIEVYSDKSFYGENTHKATAKSFEYWNKFFIRLENQLKCVLIKNRNQNISIVNQHYAEINNELAKECEIKGDNIKVYTTETGKLWFLIDNSFNLHEAETVGKSAKEDMEEIINPFFNDLRNNKVMLPSEMQKLLYETISQTRETATGLNTLIKLLTPKEQIIQATELERVNYIG